MSSVFHSPKRPKIPPPVAEPEPIQMVEEGAEEQARNRRKRLAGLGAASTRISGIQSALMSALKKRLGE